MHLLIIILKHSKSPNYFMVNTYNFRYSSISSETSKLQREWVTRPCYLPVLRINAATNCKKKKRNDSYGSGSTARSVSSQLGSQPSNAACSKCRLQRRASRGLCCVCWVLRWIGLDTEYAILWPVAVLFYTHRPNIQPTGATQPSPIRSHPLFPTR
jgi:hypothetical protein